MGKTGIIIVLVLILIGGGVYFFITNSKIPNVAKKTQAPSLGEQIYTQTKNPLDEKLPETNPFAAETNPAKKAYPNPFEK